ncbi:MAG: hypothetical protein EXR65_02215 [Dehalococcoidia bacterium]|nr:hypothetical protein [Dehalococcoidia bacterium]
MTGGALARRRRRRQGGAVPGRGWRGGWRRLALLGVVVLVLLAATLGGGTLLVRARYDAFVSGVAPPEELLSKLPRGGARIYDRNGELLYEFVDELGGLRRPVPLAEISSWLVQASVATEDATFWENNGLNVRGLLRAGLENFSPIHGSVFEGSGGSSITQQLAKNVYIPRNERTQRSVQRKLKETAIALELTRRYSKQQIMEWYLNSISYGGIYVGVEAAAQGYFGKAASTLTLAESALLAGIPQQPALYDPYQNLDSAGQIDGAAKARQREVLNLMVRQHDITQKEADRIAEQPLKLQGGRFEIEAAHFVLNRVAPEIRKRFGDRALFDAGLDVTTTLDLPLQQQGQKILEQWITEYEQQSGGHNGAMLALDPRSGQILVYIGSRDYFRDQIEGRNDNIVSGNSPGSTLKPFTYMNAFMRGWSTGTAIIDAPFEVIDASTGDPFSPTNPIKEYQGVITAEKALGNSLNIPAFKTIIAAGVPETVSLLKQVGFTTLNDPRGYGPALTLGGVDITLLDMTVAYSVLANGGVMRGQLLLAPGREGERPLEPVALLKVTNSEGKVLYELKNTTERRVVPSNYSYIVTSILANGDNECITFGVCSALALPDGRPAAVKTGTSAPFESQSGSLTTNIGDTWAMGYTPELVAGVWAGNSDNAPMVNILSTSISWHSWRDFMVAASTRLKLPPTPFTRPPGVVERELCWPSGRLPTDLCPKVNRYPGLFAEDVLPRNKEDEAKLADNWWQRVRIDNRTGLLATASTPAGAVSEEVRLVLPADAYVASAKPPAAGAAIATAPKQIWPAMQAWLFANGLASSLAPAEASTSATALISVAAPTAGQTVRERVSIMGRAAPPAFQRYSLEWGHGSAPTRWVRILTASAPVALGTLGSWDTLTVPNGAYTVRLVVTDRELGELRYAVPVTVDNGSRAPATDPSLWAQIASPTTGTTVSGEVVVRGSGFSASTLQLTVEFGAGFSPTEWIALDRYAGARIDAALARWDTSKLPNGAYTLRLSVLDRTLGSTEATTTVTVKNKKS